MTRQDPLSQYLGYRDNGPNRSTARTDPIATPLHSEVRKAAPQPKGEGPFDLVFKVGNVYGGNHATAQGEVISRPFVEGQGKAYFAHIQSYTIPEVTVYGADGKLAETHPAITGSNVLIPLNGAGRSKAERKVTQYVLQQAIYGQADPTFNEWHDSQFGRKSKFTHKKKKPRWRR